MVVAEAQPGARAGRRARSRSRAVFRDPARTFLVLALGVGVYFACVVPHFGGIDEPAHFYRSYQISTGRFVPIDAPGTDFSGACLPLDVIAQLQRSVGGVYVHNLTLSGVPVHGEVKVDPDTIQRCPDDPSQGFVTFSTFGSPVPYLPQAATAFVTRHLGFDVDAMLVAERLTVLLAYCAIVWAAIRRATRSRWAFCAVGLLPVALFQASASVSHDALTIAVALLVVSSAVRMCDAPRSTPRGRLFVEAALLTALLAACKPGYVVLAVCYLLPLCARDRRRDLWPLVFAPVLGAVASVVWNSIVGNLWKTDAGYFGVKVHPAEQRHLLLTEPWDFAGAAVRSVVDDGWHWTKQLFTMGPSVAVWPTLAVLAALVIWAAVSVQRAKGEAPGLAASQRVLLLLVFVAGALLVLGAQYVYWSRPGADVVDGMQARFFVPLLVLLPLAAGPAPGRWARSDTARVPVALATVPVFVALAVTIAFRMY